MFKISTITGAVLVVTGFVAHAGVMGSIDNVADSPRWDIGGKALYLQPSLNEDRYTHQRTITMVSGASAVWGMNPDYNWGFFLEGSYHVNAKNDFNLNWYRLNNSDNVTRADLDNTLYQLQFKQQWDAVNLESGYSLDLDPNKMVRLHAGAQFAHLSNSELLGAGAGTIDGRVILGTQSTDGHTSYNGFGPRAGFNFNYDWHQFGVYSNVAGAVLAGSTKFSKYFTFDTGTSSVSNASTMTVVPEIDAALGAKYHYLSSYGDLTLDGGWMWVNYWGALDALDISGLGTVQATNISFQGPYLGLHWLGKGV